MRFLLRASRHATARLLDLTAKLGAFAPKHPFSMRTTFRHCLLVNWSMEPSVLARHLPRGLEPDVRNGRAFLSVVIADLEAMRPGFLPRALGNDFTQVVYRAIVKAPNGERGVYFVRSDADDWTMGAAGNVLSNFHFHLADALWHGRDRLAELHPSKLEDESGARPTIAAPARARWLPTPSLLAARAPPRAARADESAFFALEPRARADRAAIRASFDLRGGGSLAMPAASRFAGDDVREAQRFFVELYAAFNAYADAWTAVRIDRTRWHVVALEHGPLAEYELMTDSAYFAPGECELDSTFYVHGAGERPPPLHDSRALLRARPPHNSRALLRARPSTTRALSSARSARLPLASARAVGVRGARGRARARPRARAHDDALLRRRVPGLLA